MLPYFLKRLLLAIPALWLMATAVFLLSRLLPGSFASERILEKDAGYYSKGSEKDRQAAYLSYIRRTGQDQPLFYFSVAPALQPLDSLYRTYSATKHAADQALESQQRVQQGQTGFAYLIPEVSWHGRHNQYHQWLVQLLQGDFGNSYRSSRPVLALLMEAISNTWWLLICSMLFTFVLALELSILMAKRRGKALRKLLLPFLFVIDSIPLFVLALLLLVLLANPDFLQLFPVFGMGYYSPQPLSFWQQLSQWWQYMALPMLCLVLANLPYITNQIYASIHAAMQADYTRTARAKGLAEGAIIRRHVLRNSLLPIITLVSDFLPALVAGTLIIETIFAVPGIGRLLVESVLARDYPVLIGIVLIVAAFRIIAFLLADLGYAWADPRIKQQLV